MTKKKRKNSRERRALVGALCTAAVIVAGSTFAWFTSQDEVTNRLSASANYDVSIAEDFQPPENWLPGQKINKDVSAVNTGNVDAFVRMWLGGQMRLLNEETTTANMKEAVKPTNTSLTSDLAAVTDKDMLALGLTWQKTAEGGTPVYYRTLSTKKISNANDENHAGTLDEDTNVPGMFSEVQSMMAGGVLVMAPEKAAYSWKLEQATEMKTYSGDNDATGTVTNIAKDTVVGTFNSNTATSKISSKDTNYYGAIDASTFQPETEGLYLFRRNVKETADGTANTYEYSGYYYVPASGSVPEQYFALHTDTGANGESDYVLPSGVIDDNSTAEPSKDQVLPVTIATNQKVYLYTATEKVIDTGTADTNLIWKYNAPDTTKTTDLEKNGYFTVTYKGADGKTGTDTVEGVLKDYTADDIVINVALANISDAAEAWTAIYADNANNHLTTFYYNNDVESGDTTTKLVDSVELSKDTKNGAYLAFDFDLNVFLESIQVTMDEAGVEQIDPATAEWSKDSDPAVNTKITTGKVKATNTGAEITSIEWNKTT
ncbi:MAG: BsaA family SipW-dependent biofilm matrix protein [Oscillospiraceae bacterium]